jgi:hypothetical protein
LSGDFAFYVLECVSSFCVEIGMTECPALVIKYRLARGGRVLEGGRDVHVRRTGYHLYSSPIPSQALISIPQKTNKEREEGRRRTL